MPRPIRAFIHQNALTHNLNIARKHASQHEVFAVVKANAYGHGIERVYSALKTADGFALLDIDEAKRLRALGWTGPILLLEGIFSPQDLFDCTAYQLSFSLHSEIQAKWVRQHPESAQFDIFLKMNSGMNRLGFQPKDYPQVWQTLKSCAAVKSLTHMMHFSDADGERLGQSGIDEQLKIFEDTVQDLPGERSICNSAAILRHCSQLTSKTVRAGILLYGSSPDFPKHHIQDWDLQPSMSLRSEIIAIQDLQPMQTVGYGSTFQADQAMKIGIVACGYADGYQRISATGTPVLVDGIRTRTIGRISMDMLAVDLTEIKNVEIGSEVVLWGKSRSGTILPIDEVAEASDTVGYELMCGVTARVPFLLKHKDRVMSVSDIERINSNQVMSSATIFNQVVYLSGQVPKNTELDIEGQTREILATIDQLLAQAKSDKSRLLSAQLFIKNLDDFAQVNAIWTEWLDGLATPARATIQADLVNPAWLIEIAVIAAQQ